ncbi:hypothetical protein [Rhodopila sp.]|uniref:hypothetical protein n=1 Tax=Rhodopila sp. TaxID=2480087 RepID=UPI003D10B705
MRILLLAAAVIVSLPLCGAVSAADQGNAQDSAKPITTGSTQPHLGNGPAVEKSLPSQASDATRTTNTGATDQDKTVKSMNNNAKAKVDTEGK